MKHTPMRTPIATSPNTLSSTPRFTVRVDGTDLHFTALACLTLLQSAEGADIAGLTLESSCRNGTCRACMCQLVDGQIAYRIDWPGLSPDEKRDRLILPCVAYPMSDIVIRLLV